MKWPDSKTLKNSFVPIGSKWYIDIHTNPPGNPWKTKDLTYYSGIKGFIRTSALLLLGRFTTFLAQTICKKFHTFDEVMT